MKALLGSKKFIVTIAGLITVIASKLFGLNIDETTTTQIIGAVMAYSVGQGIADSGKEAAKETAKAAAAVAK